MGKSSNLKKCGCLILVRAASDEIMPPLDWATCFERHTAVPQILAQVQLARRGAVAAPEKPTPENDTPTQVLLTDWLQMLHRAFVEKTEQGFRPRIGIVVSAWDAVPLEQSDREPSQYLRDNFPMLYQFAEANAEDFDFHFFGVSVVSGDLKNDDDFRKASRRGNPP